MFTSFIVFPVGTIFLYGSAWLLELLSPTRKHLRAEDRGKFNIPETGEQCGQGDVNFELTCSKAHLTNTNLLWRMRLRSLKRTTRKSVDF